MEYQRKAQEIKDIPAKKEAEIKAMRE